MPWRQAMTGALYGPDGFFARADADPAAHFRTSAAASPAFAGALLRLVEAVDVACGQPPTLDVVDVGAGRGLLLARLHALAGPGLRARLRLRGVERAARPPHLPAVIAWTDELPPPASLTGILIATEWLDNVPLDIAQRDGAGEPRYVLVDPTGHETLGPPLNPADRAWLDRWYGDEPRAELGQPRDEAWAQAVGALDRGLAVTVDYGHTRSDRPPGGTLTAFRDGRQLPPVPDTSRDLTAHVALDAVQAAGEAVAGSAATRLSQRRALAALGVTGQRPPLAKASTDPVGYLAALASATEAAELLAPGGLGAHWWLLQPVRISAPTLPSGMSG